MNVRCLFRCLAPLGVGLFSAALWAGDVALTNGQNADDLVGQTDSGGNPVYTQGTVYNSQRLDGFFYPYDVKVDTVSHRLFVLDYNSSRVVEYDLDSSNVLVDRTGDHVLGQPNFYSNRSGTTISKLSYPVGMNFDASSNRLFVADNSNSRVVIFDVASITDGENAVNELGQANFTSNAQNTTINGMRYAMGVAYDSGNQRLFVSDTYNHRVLVFDLNSITDGENAVNVLGQDTFTTNTSSTSIKGLYYPRHLACDSAGNRLFVADQTNHRVMVFDVASITDGENAVNVLGQTTFTANSTGLAINRLSGPFGVSYDSANQRLFVGDRNNARVMIFDVASITDGENAVNELGQTNFTGGSARTYQYGLNTPSGVSFDGSANRLYVAEYGNSRVTSFDVSTTTITNGENAENVVGQTNGAGGGVYTTYTTYDSAVQKGMEMSFDVVVDTVSHRLFVAEYYAYRVLVYNLDASNTLVDRTADHVLGQLDFTHTLYSGINQASISYPVGLAFDPSRNYLFASDYYANRVLVYDVNSITDGENAINVLGQANFTASGNAATQAGMYQP